MEDYVRLRDPRMQRHPDDDEEDDDDLLPNQELAKAVNNLEQSLHGLGNNLGRTNSSLLKQAYSDDTGLNMLDRDIPLPPATKFFEGSTVSLPAGQEEYRRQLLAASRKAIGSAPNIAALERNRHEQSYNDFSSNQKGGPLYENLPGSGSLSRIAYENALDNHAARPPSGMNQHYNPGWSLWY